jgi:poly(A) polymerase
MQHLSHQPWMTRPETASVFDALEAAGGSDCARFVGGCVRDAIMGRTVGDIDIATTLEPEAVIAALKAARLGFAPTGLAHGTVTAISNHAPHEITTLRRDVSTDGRWPASPSQPTGPRMPPAATSRSMPSTPLAMGPCMTPPGAD